MSSVSPFPCTPAIADLARADFEVDVADHVLIAGIDDRQVAHDECRLARRCGSLVDGHSTARPTIIEASSALVAVGGASPTTFPRRMTVMRSATSRTSRSLWVMNTMDVPRPQLTHHRHQFVGLLRCQHRGRLVEDEHLRVARQRLDDLDALLDPDREVLDEGIGIDVEPNRLEISRTFARAAARSSRPPALVCSCRA